MLLCIAAGAGIYLGIGTLIAAMVGAADVWNWCWVILCWPRLLVEASKDLL
jgi:hypothetical protein